MFLNIHVAYVIFLNAKWSQFYIYRYVTKITGVYYVTVSH